MNMKPVFLLTLICVSLAMTRSSLATCPDFYSKDDHNFDLACIKPGKFDPWIIPPEGSEGEVIPGKVQRAIIGFIEDKTASIKSFLNLLDDAEKKLPMWWPLFPLGECSCETFSRGTLLTPSIRTAYVDHMVKNLVSACDENSCAVSYASFGSGDLLTDFSIVDAFLTERPNATITVHCIDPDYISYVRIENDGKVPSEFLYKFPYGGDLALAKVPFKAISGKLSFEKNETTPYKAKRGDKFLTYEKEQLVTLILTYLKFKKFLYLIEKRHSQAKLNMFVWDSAKDFEEHFAKTDPKLGFIGSIDVVGMNVFNDRTESLSGDALEIVYKACVKNKSECRGLAVGSEIFFDGISFEAPRKKETITINRLLPPGFPETKGWETKTLADGSTIRTKRFKVSIGTAPTPEESKTIQDELAKV